MEKYIFTFEDGSHRVGTSISEDDKQSTIDGYLSIIRCSDARILMPNMEWVELPKIGE